MKCHRVARQSQSRSQSKQSKNARSGHARTKSNGKTKTRPPRSKSETTPKKHSHGRRKADSRKSNNYLNASRVLVGGAEPPPDVLWRLRVPVSPPPPTIVELIAKHQTGLWCDRRAEIDRKYSDAKDVLSYAFLDVGCCNAPESISLSFGAPQVVAKKNNVVWELADWQGLDIMMLFEVFRYAPDRHRTGVYLLGSSYPGETMAEFLDVETPRRLTRFFATILHGLIEEKDRSTTTLLPPDVYNTILVMYTGVARILAYLENQPSTGDDIDSNSTHICFQLSQTSITFLPDPFDIERIEHQVIPGFRVMPSRGDVDFRRELSSSTRKRPANSAAEQLTGNSKRYRAEKTSLERHTTFRAFIDNHTETPSPSSPRTIPQTVVLLNTCHGHFSFTSGTESRMWRIPRGKSLILVSPATPGCVTISSVNDQRVIRRVIAAEVRAANVSGTFIHPLSIAENSNIISALRHTENQSYTLTVPRTRAAHTQMEQGHIVAPTPNFSDLEFEYLQEFSPIQTTYFTGGDLCLDKKYSRTKSQDIGRAVTLFECAAPEGVGYDIAPPYLGYGKVSFCLSEVASNMYRQGFNHVVMFDMSCSNFGLRRNATEHVRQQLISDGFAGGASKGASKGACCRH